MDCRVTVVLRRERDGPALVHLAPGAVHGATTARFAVATGVAGVPHAEATLFTDAVSADPSRDGEGAGHLRALVELFRAVPPAQWQAELAGVAPGSERAATGLFLAADGPWRLPVAIDDRGGPPVQVPQAYILAQPAAGSPFDRVLLHGPATLRHGLQPRPGLLPEATVEVIDGPRALVVAGSFATHRGLHFHAALPARFAPSQAERATFLATLAAVLRPCVSPG